MEYFDIRTPDGKVTGKIKERSLVHRDGDLHGTSHIWLVRKNTENAWEVLLQKRSACKDSHPGEYDISSAGHLPAGQDFLESALRELEEELGKQLMIRGNRKITLTEDGMLLRKRAEEILDLVGRTEK